MKLKKTPSKSEREAASAVLGITTAEIEAANKWAIDVRYERTPPRLPDAELAVLRRQAERQELPNNVTLVLWRAKGHDVKITGVDLNHQVLTSIEDATFGYLAAVVRAYRGMGGEIEEREYVDFDDQWTNCCFKARRPVVVRRRHIAE